VSQFNAQLAGSLDIGAGTDYPWAEFPAGFGTPSVRTQDVARPDRDGVFPGLDLLDARLLVFDVHILGDSETDGEDKLNVLKAFFSRSDDNVELVVNITGTVEYALVGRPRGVDVVLDKKLRSGVYRARCSFVATDPRLYVSDNTVTVIAVATGEGVGLEFDATPDFSFGGTITEGTAVLVNSGLYPTPFRVEFAGPLTNPRIINADTGYELSFSGELLTGETLLVDTDTRTVLLNGTASRYSWLSTQSRWFDLPPGNTTLQFIAVAGTGTATITYRSAYV